MGRTRVTINAETGDALPWEQNLVNGSRSLQARSLQDRRGYSTVGATADRSFGPLHLSAGITSLTEAQTLLGARFGGFAGLSGAQTLFVDAGASLDLGHGWSMTGAWRSGWTRIRAGGLRDGADSLISSSWSLDLAGRGLLARGDRFGLRVAQPLRVARGGFDLTVPIAYDYGTRGVTYGNRFFNLAPTGREIDVEAVWSQPFGQGWVGTNLFWRKDPSNIASAPNDIGMAVRYRQGF